MSDTINYICWKLCKWCVFHDQLILKCKECIPSNLLFEYSDPMCEDCCHYNVVDDGGGRWDVWCSLHHNIDEGRIDLAKVCDDYKFLSEHKL